MSRRSHTLQSYRTLSINSAQVTRGWVLVDAAGEVVGRMASRVAAILKGKLKPCYTPHVLCGDHVIIVNAEKAIFTGKKEEDKRYISYTGYPGGQRVTSPKMLREKHPARILEKAVKGMLPKNKLGRQMFQSLFIYSGPEHPHAAQKPLQEHKNQL